MIDSIVVRVSNAGTLSVGAFPVSSVSSIGKHIQINGLAAGTSVRERMSISLADSNHDLALEDVEQSVEDAIDDDSEEVWRTFLEIEPHYRTTNRWLAES